MNDNTQLRGYYCIESKISVMVHYTNILPLLERKTKLH